MACDRCGYSDFGPDTGAGAPCPACGQIQCAKTPDDDNAAYDFDAMLQVAARDSRPTAAKVSLQQARFGSTSLLAAGALYFVMGTMCLLPQSMADQEGRGFVLLGLALLYIVAPAIFLGLYVWARRAPLVPVLIGLLLYGVLLLPGLLFQPNIFIALLDVAILLALIDALRAAINYRRFLQKAAIRDD